MNVLVPLLSTTGKTLRYNDIRARKPVRLGLILPLWWSHFKGLNPHELWSWWQRNNLPEWMMVWGDAGRQQETLTHTHCLWCGGSLGADQFNELILHINMTGDNRHDKLKPSRTLLKWQINAWCFWSNTTCCNFNFITFRFGAPTFRWQMRAKIHGPWWIGRRLAAEHWPTRLSPSKAQMEEATWSCCSVGPLLIGRGVGVWMCFLIGSRQTPRLKNWI